MDKRGVSIKRTISAQKPPTGWLEICFSKSVVRRAFLTALIVGVVLNAINHAEAVMRGTVTRGQWIRIALTFCVPYCVSAYSSVRAILDMRRPPAGATTTQSPGDIHDSP